MFVVDASHSVGAQNWFMVKQWIIDVMSALNIKNTESHVGVVVYSSSATLQIGLDDSYDLATLASKLVKLHHEYSVCFATLHTLYIRLAAWYMYVVLTPVLNFFSKQRRFGKCPTWQELPTHPLV